MTGVPSQERAEIDGALEAVNALHRDLEGADRETVLSLLLALSVQAGKIRDAAVAWYVVAMAVGEGEV